MSCTSIHTLTGTAIADIVNYAQELATRTHRQSAHTENPAELWYYRDSTWRLFPVQPLYGPEVGIELTQIYKQPATLGFTLPDTDGNYQSENQNSPYNVNGVGAYDALVDEARKICLRVGTKCYANLAAGLTPTSTLAPSLGALTLMTEGLTGLCPGTPSLYTQFAPVSQATFSITVDLGASKLLYHTVIRFGTSVGTCSLPANVQVSVSTDGASYKALPARPVHGDGITESSVPGDWIESPTGQTCEFAFCDMQVSARYVKFIVTPIGSQTLWIDELAVYGGTSSTVLGCNIFTGYMGDQIEFTAKGQVQCIAVDVLKRLADNNDNFLTAAYRLTSAGGIELADIVHSLLTSTGYWKSLNTKNDYDSPLTAAEVGWSSGSALTGLRYPLWQGQSNSMLGYCQELFAVIGWYFYADGNGVIQAIEPPYTQKLPDRVCVAAVDGNYDVWGCKRHRTGKNMRNRVIVQTGKSASSGSGSITSFDPNSISTYGTRTTRITDPLAATPSLRQKVANHFIRDYAWNLQTLTNSIRPQFETRLKHIFGFRAPARPNLFCSPSASPGQKRKQELWSLMSMKHNITYGQWTADCEWIPYVAQIADAPNFTALNIIGGNPDALTILCDVITDVNVDHIRIYTSIVSEFAVFTAGSTFPKSTGGAILPATTGVPIWVYLVAVDAQGNESLPSQILKATPNVVSQAITCYTITDFTVSSVLTQGPDNQGVYTYQFLGTWTAPSCGFTQSDVRAYVGVAYPSDATNPNSWPIHEDAWNWWAPDRISAGLTWDNVTPGLLDFVFVLRTTSNLIGLRMNWIIWNSARTRAWRPIIGNSCFVVVA